MRKLKPCPFCGEKPVLILHNGYYSVKCQNINCPSKLFASINQKDIVDAWNTRLKPKREGVV